MTADSYRYFAFISYSRRDLEFAHELQRHLEGYRLPSELCEQYPQTRRELNPLFRDQNNLGAGPLDQRLMEALAASRFLVVICSEHSANPNAEGKNYIDDEIRNFLAINPQQQIDRIIPVIYRKNETCRLSDCLPPALRELNLNGYDVLDKGRERCFSDVVASLLGLDIDVIWNHYVQDTKPQVACYADYVECHNIPRGICKLGPEAVQRRQYHYRFTTQGGLVREVMCCNSAGRPIRPDAEWLQTRPVGMRLEYDGQGQAIRCIHLDEYGKGVMEWAFSGSRFIDFQSMDNIGLRTLSHQGSPKGMQRARQSTNSITRMDVTRDEEGRIVQEMFCNIGRRRCADEHGFWGRRYERDALGRITSMLHLDREGMPAENKQGLSGYGLLYEGDGPAAGLSSMVCLNRAGEVVAGADTWAKVQCFYDENGNIHQKSYLTPDNRYCLNGSGYAATAMMYDERGNRTKGAYFNVENELSPNCNNIALYCTDYDERGLRIGESYFDAEGKPCCVRHEHFAALTWLRDEKGQTTEEAYYDGEGKPCLNKLGYAKVRFTRDEHDNIIEKAFYGTDGQYRTDSYARITWCYDEDGHETEEATFDWEGKPCADAFGSAKTTRQYDERGNEIERAHFGADGKPCAHEYDNARFVQRYDERGNCIEEKRYNTRGMLASCTYGCARVVMVYDEEGRLTEKTYMPEFGRRVYRYDTKGNPISQENYDKLGRRCKDKNGRASTTWRYNEEGQEIEEAWFDAAGRPCPNSEGYTRITSRYSEEGWLCEKTWHGDGTTCVCTYNKQGRPLDTVVHQTATENKAPTYANIAWQAGSAATGCNGQGHVSF